VQDVSEICLLIYPASGELSRQRRVFFEKVFGAVRGQRRWRLDL
jgi:hypothetical protein